MASEPTPHSTGPHTPALDADPNSSSSTLVNHGPTSVSAHDPASPGSPVSAPFDPSAFAPLSALRDGPLYPITEVQLRPAATDVNALWAHRLSASFGAIADQIAAASRALAVPPSTPAANSSGGSQGAEVTALAARLDIIERAQEQLGADLQQVQAQLARLQVSSSGSSSGSASAKQKEHAAEVAIMEVESDAGEGPSGFKSAAEIAIEELQKKVDGAIDTIKLEQARLYARLHNATVTSNKMGIKAPTMANGKPPQNFPNTKGEFEHLTKERYELLLKSYGIVPKGDTKAKREQLREFIGLTPPSN
ncbi:hypothetical protein LXA43DRAFT_427831 [Ganoderma leucocontextum]|nr:hypothetical protein LXA43DRAFT_427831 [Ganoderma leucocontextum]